jgi:hypothetical protein
VALLAASADIAPEGLAGCMVAYEAQAPKMQVALNGNKAMQRRYGPEGHQVWIRAQIAAQRAEG